jgi:hypothetical protein
MYGCVCNHWALELVKHNNPRAYRRPAKCLTHKSASFTRRTFTSGPTSSQIDSNFFLDFRPMIFSYVKGFDEAFIDVAVSCGENNLRLVVTGDITAGGLQTEFAAAHTYLSSVWIRTRQGPNHRVGLNLPLDRQETIPGNHDHWDGSRFPVHSYRPHAIARHFRNCRGDSPGLTTQGSWKSNCLVSTQIPE